MLKMGVLSEYGFIQVLVYSLTLATGMVYLFYKQSFKYWKKRNVPYAEPKIPFGNLSNPLTQPEQFGEFVTNYYNVFKKTGAKHCGMFVHSTPLYVPIDPEYIRHIMSKDFNHFIDRGVYYNEKNDPLSAHLFSLEGVRWKNLRVKLTPTFTSGKIKMMFSTLVSCGNQLKDAMDDLSLSGDSVNIKELFGRYTFDVIGSCAFGIDCNSFKDPNSEFCKRAKRVFNLTKLEAFQKFLSFASPSMARLFQIRMLPKESTDFFMKVIKNTVTYRETNKIVRNDFMHLLLELKNNKDEDGITLTFNELAAQAFVFFLGSFETSATTMTFCLYELAINSEIQDKARQEVKAVLKKYGGKVTYEAAMEMKYLGQVIDETLRKYPPLPSLNRICTADYELPDSDLIIKKGMHVLIPILGLQHNPDFFPDPERFDPERFNDENKSKINPFTYMPFGVGPRVCIGLRFGVLETKVGLALLLNDYKFSLNKKTQMPLIMNPMSFILSPIGDIWLNATRV